MKTVIYIIISIFCVWCNGQIIQNNEKNKNTKGVIPMDTLSILQLTNNQYGSSNYKVLRLCNLDSNGYWIDSTRRIELTRDNKTLVSFSLPVPDEEVKNFSVSRIAETKSGFIIVADWGGGNYFFGRKFYFNFRDNQFYLDSLKMNSHVQEPEKETCVTKKISPPIPIDKFGIFQYLENE